MTNNETFFTTLGCMDGRVQAPVAAYGRGIFHAMYGDTITEAGLVGILAQEPTNIVIRESLKRKILISIEKHHSAGIIVHGHQECAGNPVEDRLHREHIKRAVFEISNMVPASIVVTGIFVKRDEHEWIVEEIKG